MLVAVEREIMFEAVVECALAERHVVLEKLEVQWDEVPVAESVGNGFVSGNGRICVLSVDPDFRCASVTRRNWYWAFFLFGAVFQRS